MNTQIECPGCKTKTVVGHLKWSALSCPNCKTFYDLAPWLINAVAMSPNQVDPA